MIPPNPNFAANVLPFIELQYVSLNCYGFESKTMNFKRFATCNCYKCSSKIDKNYPPFTVTSESEYMTYLGLQLGLLVGITTVKNSPQSSPCSWDITPLYGEIMWNLSTFPSFFWLVVWTPLKKISQLGWLFPIYGKIENGNQTTNQFLLMNRRFCPDTSAKGNSAHVVPGQVDAFGGAIGASNAS